LTTGSLAPVFNNTSRLHSWHTPRSSHCFKCAGRKLHLYKRLSSLTQMLFFFKFGVKVAGDHLGDVLADARPFSCETATVILLPLTGRAWDAENFGSSETGLVRFGRDNGGEARRVKGISRLFGGS